MDSLHGTSILEQATIVKLTKDTCYYSYYSRTLYLAVKKDNTKERFSLTKAIPNFILWFLLASLITTVAMSMGVPAAIFAPLKDLFKIQGLSWP